MKQYFPHCRPFQYILWQSDNFEKRVGEIFQKAVAHFWAFSQVIQISRVLLWAQKQNVNTQFQ